MISYHEFLKRKRDTEPPDGIDVPEGTLHPRLFDWQKRIVSWALKVGRAAIWADTGLGKTMMQLEWARRFDGRRLVVAPLAVCEQTCREARKLDLTATYVRTPDEITGDGVWVTNYERVESFPADMFNAVVLDEASILKQSTGKTRTMLINHFKPVRHRLACTATPAPNDPEELTSQAEFLGHSTRQEILATYFTNNLGADKGSGWRLKGHGRTAFMRWLAQWAIALRKPSDIGGSDAGFELPGLPPHDLLRHQRQLGILLPVDPTMLPIRAAPRRGRAHRLLRPRKRDRGQHPTQGTRGDHAQRRPRGHHERNTQLQKGGMT